MEELTLDEVKRDIESGRNLHYRERIVHRDIYEYLRPGSYTERETVQAQKRIPFKFVHCKAGSELAPNRQVISLRQGDLFTHISGESKKNPISISEEEAEDLCEAMLQKGESVYLFRVKIERRFNLAGPLYPSSEPSVVDGELRISDCSFDNKHMESQLSICDVVFLRDVEFGVLGEAKIAVCRATFHRHVWVRLEGPEYLYLTDVEFRNSVSLRGDLLRNVIVMNTSFHDTSYIAWKGTYRNLRSSFSDCKFVGPCDFADAQLRQAEFERVWFHKGAKFGNVDSFEHLIIRDCVIAGYMDLSPKVWTPSPWPVRAWRWFRHLPTDTHTTVERTNADACTNALFRRWVLDTNYLNQFRERHPILYKAWLVSSDCGQSFSLWLTWSMLLTLGFALIFWGLVKNFSVKPNDNVASAVGFFDALYFSVVTFTTLGFGDVTPVTVWGKAAVVVEVVLGYLMLGGLISIFADKLARRS